MSRCYCSNFSVTSCSCHLALNLLVLLMCIAPSSLPLASTDSHTPLSQSPNMEATTPPFTESGRYPFYPLLMISSSEQSIPCLCSLYTNCKVWCVGAHPSMHVCTYIIILVCDTVCSYHISIKCGLCLKSR